jgi:hypothetical protein
MDNGLRLPAAPGEDGGLVEVPYQPVFNTTNAFSIELWVKPSQTRVLSALATSYFLPGANWPRAGWLLDQANSGRTAADSFSFYVYNTSGNTARTLAAAPMSISTNAWYHLVGVFDGTTVMLYVNGANTASSSLPAGHALRPNQLRPLSLGCGAGYGGWYSGDMDEVAFYTNALSAAQVLAHYQAGTNAAPATPYAQVVLNDSPVCYWRLGEPAAPPIPAPTPVARMVVPQANPQPKAQPLASPRFFDPFEQAEDLLPRGDDW